MIRVTVGPWEIAALVLTVAHAGAGPVVREHAAVDQQAKPVAGTSARSSRADNWWHADVRGLPVHARSRQWLSHMSTGVDLHPDFGPSYGDGPNYGIPITVVKRRHPKVRVRFDYASESDKVRYPLGRDTRIEGGRGSAGDKHAIVVDKGRCRLYETWNTRVRERRWVAGSGAVWSLKSNALRPDGWTSADAAGLPILPGLLRWNEVKAGEVDHAIRFTTDVTSRHHLWPARHDAGSRPASPTRRWGAVPPAGRASRPRALGVRRRGDRGDEGARAGARRQRVAVVLPGRAERALAGAAGRGAEGDPGVGVRRGGHLVAAGVSLTPGRFHELILIAVRK